MSENADPWDQLNADYAQWAEVLDGAEVASLFTEAIAGAYDAGRHGVAIHPVVHGGVFRDTLARLLAAQAGKPGKAKAEREQEIAMEAEDMKCRACDGLGYDRHRDGRCPSCFGTGER